MTASFWAGYAALLMLSLPALALLLVALGRHDESTARQRWTFVLDPGAQDTLRAVVDDLRLHLRLACFALVRADRAPTTAPSVVAAFCTRASLTLADVKRGARMLRALEPMTPVSPGNLRSSELRALAGSLEYAHHMLASVAERWVLRTVVLGWLLRLLPGVLAWVVWRRHWQRLPALESDLRAVARQVEDQVESFVRSAHAIPLK